MKLLRHENGTYTIRSKKEAVAALELFHTLLGEINELREEHGIGEMEEDCTELKKAVTTWAIESKTEQIDLDGRHATLIETPYDARFIGTKGEIPTDPAELFRFGLVDDSGESIRKVVPLHKIIFGKFKRERAKEVWMQITKRVINPSALEEAIAEGILTVDDVAPSFIEKNKTPYLRIFED